MPQGVLLMLAVQFESQRNGSIMPVEIILGPMIADPTGGEFGEKLLRRM
jgi:hypothetical protein